MSWAKQRNSVAVQIAPPTSWLTTLLFSPERNASLSFQGQKITYDAIELANTIMEKACKMLNILIANTFNAFSRCFFLPHFFSKKCKKKNAQNLMRFTLTDTPPIMAAKTLQRRKKQRRKAASRPCLWKAFPKKLLATHPLVFTSIQKTAKSDRFKQRAMTKRNKKGTT